MNDNFSIEISSDLDFENIVANILYKEETFAILSQDKGIENLEIKILPTGNNDLMFPLKDLLDIIESAKKNLISMKKLPEKQLNFVSRIPMNKKYPCVCCGFLTKSGKETGTFEICPVCFWEDDNVQFNDIYFEGGANEESLVKARQNYKKFGACSWLFIDKVRPPLPEEYS